MQVEIGGRGRDDPFEIRGEALRDHVLGDGSAIADPGIEPLADHVHDPVAGNQIDLDIRVAAGHLGQHRAEDQRRGIDHGVDAHLAARRRAKLIERIEGNADIREGAGDRSLQRLASGGQRHRPVRAVHQSHAGTLFEAFERMADGRRRHAELEPGPPEVPVSRNGQEIREVGKIRSGDLHAAMMS